MSGKRPSNWLQRVIEEANERYNSLPDWKKFPSQHGDIPGEPPIYTGGRFDQ